MGIVENVSAAITIDKSLGLKEFTSCKNTCNGCCSGLLNISCAKTYSFHAPINVKIATVAKIALLSGIIMRK